MVRPIPFRRPTVFAHLIADVLNAAQNRKHLAARATVLRPELTSEALSIAEAPIDDQPRQPLAVDGPAPRCPDRAGFAIVGTMEWRLAPGLVVSGRQQELATVW